MGHVSYKIVLTGDEYVGKTAVVRRFVHDEFTEDYLPTLGFQIFIKTIEVNDTSVDLQIWDVGGQSKFEYVRKSYINFSRGFFLVYDISNHASFEHLASWLAEVRECCPTVPFVILGNKADLADVNVEAEEVQETAAEFGAAAQIQTSAKTGEHVGDAFDILAETILNSDDFD